MTVILLTQEANSPGDQVAAELAACLGLELVRQEQIEQRVAERMGVDKQSVRRLLQGNASLVEAWTIGPNRLVRYLAAEVVKLAARGNIVIQTWKATNPLRAIGHVVCVHVCAARRPALTRTSGTAVPDRRCPRSCAGLRSWLLAGGWDDFEHYDLALNTERIPLDECVEQVRRLAQGSHFRPTAASRAMLASLAKEACEVSQPVLGSDVACAVPVLEVDVAGDTIRLPTQLSSEEAIARVEQHLRGRRDCGGFAARGRSPVFQQGVQ